MPLVDSHCHLQSEAFDADREAVIGRALDTLEWLVTIGDSLESSRRGVALNRERLYAAVGIHPHHAVQLDDATLDAIRALAGERGVVAVGEIGLDYYYEYSPRASQRIAFERQLALAVDIAMPIIVHCRDAYEDIVPVLDAVHTRLAGGVMHCFSGSPAFAERCLAWGLHVSFAGNVTFKKADDLREAARAVPIDRILVETDSPYLAPQPLRGQRCEPLYVEHTARLLADIKGVPFDEFCARTTANARRVFRVEGPVPAAEGPARA
ncbi:MAG TPA: TatD family hydrolase [Candidatus Hydrogenedentes bacterium]|nr:TatD family hydrolase [Candidatus Hydrogenedentota bacterium]HPG68803.1 TatD family hydrolase [Candidatus Hydrogenedentota bacterium]